MGGLIHVILSPLCFFAFGYPMFFSLILQCFTFALSWGWRFNGTHTCKHTHNIYNRHKCAFMCTHTQQIHTCTYAHMYIETPVHTCIRTYLYLSLLNHCTSSLMLKLWLLGRTCSHLGPSFQSSDYGYFLTCTRSVLRGMWKWTRRKRLPRSVDGILAPTKLLRYLGDL